MAGISGGLEGMYCSVHVAPGLLDSQVWWGDVQVGCALLVWRLKVEDGSVYLLQQVPLWLCLAVDRIGELRVGIIETLSPWLYL